MVSCGQFKMLPMAPSTFIGLSSTSVSSNPKPKIGFSIDSIVGSNGLRVPPNNSLSPHSIDSPERPPSSCSDADYNAANNNYPLELRNSDFRVNPNETNNFRPNQNFDKSRNCKNSFDNLEIKNRSRKDSCSSPVLVRSPGSSIRSTTTRTPSPTQQIPPTSSATTIPTEGQQSSNKTPIVVPGIPAGLLRPFPVQPPNLGNLKGIPPYFSNPESGPSNSHFLAAQFQMAAALAHHHGQGGPVGFPPGMTMGQHHPPPFGSHGMVRDSYQLYPWLLSRHGRIFPHRFPGNFLLQPFRKPKRIRTAFSPTQLLKLEHAFEGNHYVVGAERKTLAQTLSLTETQVKVWFQNRRTKHKRMQQEEDGKGGSGGGSGSGDQKTGNLNDSTQNSYEEDDEEDDDDDDEVIDMDECPSDQEVEQYHQQQQQHLQQQHHQQIQQQLQQQQQQQHPYFIHNR